MKEIEESLKCQNKGCIGLKEAYTTKFIFENKKESFFPKMYEEG